MDSKAAPQPLMCKFPVQEEAWLTVLINHRNVRPVRERHTVHKQRRKIVRGMFIDANAIAPDRNAGASVGWIGEGRGAMCGKDGIIAGQMDKHARSEERRVGKE